jgi:ankyrin repeat protein
MQTISASSHDWVKRSKFKSAYSHTVSLDCKEQVVRLTDERSELSTADRFLLLAVDINALNLYGESALSTATYHNQILSVEYLLANKADPKL